MTSHYIDSPSTGKRPIALSHRVKEGLSGTIHQVIGEPGLIAKLYKDRQKFAGYRDKIAAMLAAPPNLPPFSSNGRTYIQIAWPTAAVLDDQDQFCGFTMPAVDVQAATELENVLNRKSRRRKHIPEFYGARVLLAANLAALMAELHSLGHYMVDMKPLNTMFYPSAWYMAVLDTDGFSINGRRRFPAHQYSDEYIAPEAAGQSPERLGLEQDLFALAVIIFRLLNNGVHPYSGIDLGSTNLPTTLQDRINAGLYAYGLRSNRQLRPSPSSIHASFEDDTRRLFDRAFQSRRRNRPSASEWRDHLRRLINDKVLVKCPVNPNEHAHFSKGCGLCELERRTASAHANASGKPISNQVLQVPGTVLGSLPIATPGSAAPSPGNRSSAVVSHMVAGAAWGLGLAVLLWIATASGCQTSTECLWFNWKGGSIAFNALGLFAASLVVFGAMVGRYADVFGLERYITPSWRNLLLGAAAGGIAGFVLYYPLRFGFAILNLAFGSPLAAAIALTAAGGIIGTLVFQEKFGPAPAGSGPRLFGRSLPLYPEFLAKASMAATIAILGWYALSSQMPSHVATSKPKPPDPSPLTHCERSDEANRAMAGGLEALRAYIRQCGSGLYAGQVRNALETRVFGEASACINTSCGTANCIATYTKDFPSGSRLPTLRTQAQARESSEHCKPYCAQRTAFEQAERGGVSALRSYTGACKFPQGPFFQQARNSLERLVYNEASACIQSSCNLQNCLEIYSADFPGGNMGSRLRDAARQAANSPRCRSQ